MGATLNGCYGIDYITESLIVTPKKYEHQTRSDHEHHVLVVLKLIGP